MIKEDLSAIVNRLRAMGTDDERVEVKSSADQLSKDVWESISAFANTKGGMVILGLDEHAGFTRVKSFAIGRVIDQLVTGMGDGDPLGARLVQAPAYEVHRVPFEGGTVLVVEVSELDPSEKPCYIKGRGVVGGSYKRIDDKDVRLSPSEIYALKNYLKPSDADRRLIDQSSEADLQQTLVRTLLDREAGSRALRGVRTRAARLVRLNVLGEQGEVRVAGMLALGQYPQQFFPRMVIDVALHPGNEKGESLAGERFLDRTVCEGAVVEMIDAAVAAVAKNLRTRSIVRGARRTDELEVPREVLRELIANAVVHREYGEYFQGQPVSVDIYPDRIEITNPGGLWGGKTIENIADGLSVCRNPLLLKLLMRVGGSEDAGAVVEGNGSGILYVRRVMREGGLGEPEFVPGIDYFKVVIRRGDVGARGGADAKADAGASELALPAHEPMRQTSNGEGKAGSVANSKVRLESPKVEPERWSEHVWDERIRAALDGSSPKSSREIAAELGRSISSVRIHLKDMVSAGIIVATASESSRNRRYRLS